MSNPPLINSGYYYTRGQQITIWFSMGLNYADNETIEFGEDLIRIRGNTKTG